MVSVFLFVINRIIIIIQFCNVFCFFLRQGIKYRKDLDVALGRAYLRLTSHITPVLKKGMNPSFLL